MWLAVGIAAGPWRSPAHGDHADRRDDPGRAVVGAPATPGQSAGRTHPGRVDEYAELAENVPDAASDADSIGRRGRAVAVTLIAATQRPTQKAMGQGALRSQMDVRICFRVRER